jgi:hypothetical protein
MPNVSLTEFINTIFSDVPEGETVLLSKQPKLEGAFWNTGDINEAQDWLDRRGRGSSSGSAVYFNISTVVLPAEGEPLRRRKGDCVAVYCFVADDIGTKVDDTDVAPSWVMETSAGSFQYGYLLEPVERDEHGLFEAFVRECGRLGITDAGAEGVNRLMRTPGSINLKEGKGRWASRLLEWEPSRVWTIRELAVAFDIDLDAVAVQPVGGVAPVSASGGVQVSDDLLHDMDPVVAWLAERGMLRGGSGGQWLDVVCPWAGEHTGGSDVAGYSPLGRGAEGWAMTRGFKCQHEHCSARHYREFAEWVVSEGGPACAGYDPLPWLQARYVYVVEQMMVADMHQRPRGGLWRMTISEFEGLHAGKIPVPGGPKGGVSIKTAYLSSPDTVKASRFAYLPGGDDVAEIGGQQIVNTYMAPQFSETSAAPEIFLEHITYLLPDASERELFLDWLAYKLQYPASRSYAIVMVAEAFGIGRSWVKAMLERVVMGQVQTASLGQLIGKGTSAEQTYNDWAAGCQFLCVEEAKDNLSSEDFYSGYETFKQRIDTRPVSMRINPKYGRTRDEMIFFNCLIFSNHVDALVVPDGDRRVCVLQNALEMNTPAYYQRLDEALDGVEPGRVYWWLMRRDVSGYDHVYPPMTPGKRLMIQQHRTPSDEILEWIVDNSGSNLITYGILKDKVVAAALALGHDQYATTRAGSMTSRLWKKMPSLKDAVKGCQIRFEGANVEYRELVRSVAENKNFSSTLEPDEVRRLLTLTKKGPPVDYLTIVE